MTNFLTTPTNILRRVLALGGVLIVGAACGGDEFKVPETREEQLALLDQKQHDIRVWRAQIAELERAIGGDTAAVSSRLVAGTVVEPATFQREVELQAIVESDEVGIVSVEVPGRVTRVYVDEGQYVKRGQSLLRIDQEGVGIQVAEVQTQLALARDLLARQERLRAQNIGTEVQLLEARNAVERLEKTIEQLRVQQGKSVVTAPISGTVESKAINAGELATPGVPLMQILDAATVKVVADVPETYLKSVKKGQTVRVSFPTIDETRQARITDIGRTIDPANRTFRIELDLPNSKRLFKPNMLANVYLIDYRRDNVIAVPSEAVLEEVDGREYVYTAVPIPGKAGLYTAKKLYVTTGENDSARREILSGVAAGDILVTLGMRTITDGQTVRLEDVVAAPGPDAVGSDSATPTAASASSSASAKTPPTASAKTPAQ